MGIELKTALSRYLKVFVLQQLKPDTKSRIVPSEVSHLAARMNWNGFRYRGKSSWLDREEERQTMPNRWQLRDPMPSDSQEDFFDEDDEKGMDHELMSEEDRKIQVRNEIHKNRSLKDMEI